MTRTRVKPRNSSRARVVLPVPVAPTISIRSVGFGRREARSLIVSELDPVQMAPYLGRQNANLGGGNRQAKPLKVRYHSRQRHSHQSRWRAVLHLVRKLIESHQEAPLGCSGIVGALPDRKSVV